MSMDHNFAFGLELVQKTFS